MASRIAILLIDFRCGRICTDASRRALPHSTSSTLPYSLLYPAGEEGVDTLPGKPAPGSARWATSQKHLKLSPRRSFPTQPPATVMPLLSGVRNAGHAVRFLLQVFLLSTLWGIAHPPGPG